MLQGSFFTSKQFPKVSFYAFFIPFSVAQIAFGDPFLNLTELERKALDRS